MRAILPLLILSLLFWSCQPDKPQPNPSSNPLQLLTGGSARTWRLQTLAIAGTTQPLPPAAPTTDGPSAPTSPYPSKTPPPASPTNPPPPPPAPSASPITTASSPSPSAPPPKPAKSSNSPKTSSSGPTSTTKAKLPKKPGYLKILHPLRHPVGGRYFYVSVSLNLLTFEYAHHPSPPRKNTPDRT
jgi:outer membrane biosynthesis protein TonB